MHSHWHTNDLRIEFKSVCLMQKLNECVILYSLVESQRLALPIFIFLLNKTEEKYPENAHQNETEVQAK